MCVLTPVQPYRNFTYLGQAVYVRRLRWRRSQDEQAVFTVSSRTGPLRLPHSLSK